MKPMRTLHALLLTVLCGLRCKYIASKNYPKPDKDITRLAD